MDARILSVIFFVFTVGIYTATADKFQKALVGCTQKYNLPVNFTKSLNPKNLSKEQKSIVNCLMGCTVKGGNGHKGKTLFELTLSDLERADKTMYDIKALRQKLDTCAHVGDDECKFMDCLDVYSEPWKSIVIAYM